MDSYTEVLESKQTIGEGIEHNILEVRPQRNVSGDSFGQGLQDYRFTIGGSWAWVPNRSYLRVACHLTRENKEDGPSISDNLALADNVVGSLYNNAYFRAGQQDVSSIVSYLPQASQLKNRITKSGAWTRSIGKSAFGQDPYFSSRVNTSAVDGVRNVPRQTITRVSNTGVATIAIDVEGVITIDPQGDTSAGEGIFALQGGDEIHINNQIYVVKFRGTGALGANSEVVPRPLDPLGIAATNVFTIYKAVRTPQREIQYVCWVPPIGIFDSSKPMGSGDYTLSLNPAAKYKQAAVQSFYALTPGVDFNFKVLDVSLFVSLVRVNVPPSMTQQYEFSEIQIMTKPATSSTNNQLTFSVPPSTYALAVYVQDNVAGSSTVVPPSRFKAADESDENLENIQITYSNLSKPATNFTSAFTKDENYLVQRYHDTQAECGLIFNEGGGETFSEWLERGGLYFYRFMRDADDRSTHVAVNITHADLAQNTNIHLCALYRRRVDITTTDGRVSQVISQSL